jgi:hypothetical protein
VLKLQPQQLCTDANAELMLASARAFGLAWDSLMPSTSQHSKSTCSSEDVATGNVHAVAGDESMLTIQAQM